MGYGIGWCYGRRGGKGYYALDVTDPANFSETGSAPADTLLWEFNEADMGYVYSMPPVDTGTNQAKQIVKMANGKWAVIVGNGYNSNLGKAVLYVVFIEQGIDGSWAAGDYVKIIADSARLHSGLDNGLSTPVPFDTDGDGYADTVYAGDLKGRIWKFLVGPNSQRCQRNCDHHRPGKLHFPVQPASCAIPLQAPVLRYLPQRAVAEWLSRS